MFKLTYLLQVGLLGPLTLSSRCVDDQGHSGAGEHSVETVFVQWAKFLQIPLKRLFGACPTLLSPAKCDWETQCVNYPTEGKAWTGSKFTSGPADCR